MLGFSSTRPVLPISLPNEPLSHSLSFYCIPRPNTKHAFHVDRGRRKSARKIPRACVLLRVYTIVTRFPSGIVVVLEFRAVSQAEKGRTQQACGRSSYQLYIRLAATGQERRT
ncbi:unnamed protein product [Laminaria digitata]